MSEVLQKLLMPWLSQAVGDTGYMYVGGPVTRLADVRAISTPSRLVDAHGLRSSAAFVDDPSYVDVVRFEMDPLMELRNPGGEDRPWQTFPTGFLVGEPVPVWVMERTRYPRGAELWRIHASGDQELLTLFDGAARGWRDARGYTPPTQIVGPRGVVDGQEHAAEATDPTAEHVELIALGEQVPAGFTTTRPLVSTRVLAARDCERVHEVRVLLDWLGTPARLLQGGSDGMLLLLLEQPSVEQVERTGAREVEPGYYEVMAPRDEVTPLPGIDRTLPVGPSARR